MTCHDHSSQHDGRDVQTYWSGRGLTLLSADLCRGCLRALTEIGMDWRQRAEPYRPDRSAGHGPLLDRLASVA